jgi:hypothetical protein
MGQSELLGICVEVIWKPVELSADEVAKYRNVGISKCRNIEMSAYRNVGIQKCKNIEMSKYRNVELSKRSFHKNTHHVGKEGLGCFRVGCMLLVCIANALC